jgi:hypothetical protein
MGIFCQNQFTITDKIKFVWDFTISVNYKAEVPANSVDDTFNFFKSRQD